MASFIQERVRMSDLELGMSFLSLSAKSNSKLFKRESSQGDKSEPLGDSIRKGFPNGKKPLGGSCALLILLTH